MKEFVKKLLAGSAVAGLLLSSLAPPALAQTPSFVSPVLQRPTFSSASVALAVPATGAGDAVCLVGSATRTIRVTKLRVMGTDSTAQTAQMNIVKRTAANTGGTSTQPTIASYDSSLNNGGATAVINAYTAVPTPGAGVAVRSEIMPFAAATTVSITPFEMSWAVQDLLDQSMTLRGTAQQLCVNFPNAFTTAGPVLTTTFEWTEQ